MSSENTKSAASESVYATPKEVTDLSECHFYHTIDLPGHGIQKGPFDLRAGVDDYLGRIDFRGKRVFELGPANGYLTFYMEQQGAEVVCCDLSPDLEWDIVPYDATDTAKIIDRRREHIGRQNNAFWFAHRLYKSKAKVIYTSAYEIPPEIGKFDVAIFGQVLLHIRDPFRAMECILRHCRDQVVVVETLMSRKQNFVLKLLNRLQREQTFPVFFLPRGAKQHPIDTWWKFPEWTMEEYLRVLGFEKTSVVYHEPIHHKAKSNKARLYSMVAKRPS